MAIEFNCGNCSSLLRVGDEHGGKQAKCPQCEHVNTIPYESQVAGAGQSEPPVAQPPAGQPQQPYAAPMQGAQGHFQQQMVPPKYGMPHGHFQPERGGLILALGIIGLLVCCIPGIFAWVMGKSDMKKIKAGIIDPSGESLTQIGMILGIISCVLWGLAGLFYIAMIAFVIISAGAQGM